MSRARIRKEIEALERKLESKSRGKGRANKESGFQSSPLVRDNLPFVYGGALIGGVAAGFLSRKDNRDVKRLLSCLCNICLRR